MYVIFDDFSKFCSIFGVLHFEKSSNVVKNLSKNEENPCSPYLKPQSLSISYDRENETTITTKKINGYHQRICLIEFI